MRKICGLIVLALLFSLFAACSEDPENFDVDFSGNDNGEYDLGGIEILYRSNLDSGNGGVEISENYLGYVLETGFSDLAMQRVRELENKYNFKLNVTTQKADIVTMSAGGMSFADIFLSPSFYFFSWSKTGLLTGISKLADYIDYKDSKKWGSALLLESMMYKDDLYGLTPNAWPEQNHTSFGYPLVANVDLIIENGASNPRELVEAKNWTWDVFNEELDKNTIIEGNEAKSYGFVSANAYFPQMMLLSNGVQFAVKNEEGEYECGYYSEAALRALEQTRKVLYGEYKHTVCPNSTNSEQAIENFVTEKGVYAFLPTHFIFGVYGTVSMNLDNFAILPTPIGPDVDSLQYTSTHHTMYYAISFPTMGTNTEEAAFIADKIYEPLPGYETQEDIKDHMSRNYFFDERDADVFFNLFENSYYNYDYTAGFDNRRIPEQTVRSESPLSQILEEQASVIESVFTDFVEPTLSAYDVLFGE